MARAVRAAVRMVGRAASRSRVTIAFLVLLLTIYVLLTRVVPPSRAVAFLHAISTNITNLRTRPVLALLASGLVAAPPLLSVSGVVTLGVGIAGCMAWLERRGGAAWAVGVYAAGHIGATLLTVPVIEAGIALHRYAPQVRDAFDFGISYGAAAVTAAAVGYLPRWARPLWLGSGIAYLLQNATWSGQWPDFTTVGHLLAAAIGVALAILGNRRRARRHPPGPETQ